MISTTHQVATPAKGLKPKITRKIACSLFLQPDNYNRLLLEYPGHHPGSSLACKTAIKVILERDNDSNASCITQQQSPPTHGALPTSKTQADCFFEKLGIAYLYWIAALSSSILRYICSTHFHRPTTFHKYTILQKDVLDVLVVLSEIY